MYSCRREFQCGSLLLLFILLQQRAADTATVPQQQQQTQLQKVQPGSNATNANAITGEGKTVKKALSAQDVIPTMLQQEEALQTQVQGEGEKVVISEQPGPPPHPPQGAQNEQGNEPDDEVRFEHSMDLLNDSMDFPESYTAVFYVLVGITSSAILLLIFRVYRLRLSRAERKYGVQGDRANQELTPLPMAIEDVNSDEEDHTLFEVNRQNIRIL